VKEFLGRLWSLARPDRGLVATLIAVTALAEILALPGPFLLAWIIAEMEGSLDGRNMALFVGANLALMAGQGAFAVWRVRLNRRVALAASGRVRRSFFAKLLHLPYPFFLEHQAGGLANNFLNDVDDIDRAVGGLIERGLRSIVMLLLFGGALALWNPLVGGCALVGLPLAILGQRGIRVAVRRASRRKVDRRREMMDLVSESVAHPAAVKAFVLEDAHRQRAARASEAFADETVGLETWQATLRSSASVLMIFVQYAFFVVGAWMVIEGDLTIGAFVGQLVLIGRLTGPINTLLEYGSELGRSRAAMHRVDEVMAMEDEGSGSRPLGLPALGDPAVAIEDLRFRFDPRVPLIEGWDFALRRGDTVALVGTSGSGKTTLFHLLLGLHQDYAGRILVGGRDLARTDLAELRRISGAVFQEQMLFRGSIRDNLLLGADDPDAVDDRELWRILGMAHAEDFVREIPGGLDAPVGHGGVTLSGGQRQRLAIARVLVKNPPLLLLDEATSALDTISERHVQAALDELVSERTSIVIAHRLSTVARADLILVIDGGRIVERGDHAALLAAGGIYRRLFDAQVEGFLRWDRSDGDA